MIIKCEFVEIKSSMQQERHGYADHIAIDRPISFVFTILDTDPGSGNHQTMNQYWLNAGRASQLIRANTIRGGFVIVTHTPLEERAYCERQVIV